MKRIFLIGYMGTGKTTVGRELSKALGVDFVDLDQYIQARYQKTIGQIFEEAGEEGFREIESKVLREVGEIEDVVIATGGGTPCFHGNMPYMKQVGKTIYLKASPEMLAMRLNTCKEKRPLIKNKNEDELLVFVRENLLKREPFYANAHLTFETEELVKKEDAGIFVHKLIDFINEHGEL